MTLRRLITAAFLIVALLSPALSRADKADDDFNSGVGLWRKQRYTLAADIFEQFLSDYPEHGRVPLATFYLGLSYTSLRKFDQSREKFQQYLQNNPNGTNVAAASYRVGECSYYLKDFESAAKQLQNYVQQYPDDKLIDWGRLQLAESLIQVQRWEDGDELLEQLIQKADNEDISRQAQYTRGLSLEKQQKADAAVAAYQQVAQLGNSADAVRALARAGTIRFRQKEYQQAVKLYDEIVSRFPQSRHAPSALLYAGRALLRDKAYDDAINRFSAVSKDSSQSVEATLFTGIALRQLKRIDDARVALRKAFEAANGGALAPEILFERARLEQTAGELSQAAAMYADLSDRWPADARAADALFNAASLNLELSQPEVAQRLMRRLNEDHPKRAARPAARFLSGRLLLQQDRPAEARQMLEQVAQTESADSRSVALSTYYIARIDHEAANYESALKTIRQLMPRLDDEGNKDLRGALALGAMSALELGEFDTSVQLATDYLQLVQTGRQAQDAQAARTVALANLGRYAPAIDDADALIRSAPENPQTWTAILQAAEHAWDHEQFEPALELFRRAGNDQAQRETRRAGTSGSAWCLFKLERFEEAASEFQQNAETWEGSFVGFESAYMRVRSLQEAGQLDQAIDGYAALVPQFTSAAADIRDEDLARRVRTYALDSGRASARLLGDANRIDEAHTAWSVVADALKDSDELDAVLDEWAWFNLNLGRYEESDRVYQRLLNERPDSRFAATARLSLAESLMVAKKTDDAIKEFDAIIQHPNYGKSEKAKALYHLIDLYTERESWKTVASLAEQFGLAHSDSPLAPRVQLSHADALQALNQLEESQRLLQLLRKGVLSGDLQPEPWTERVWIVLAEAALAAKDYVRVDELAKELEESFPEARLNFQMQYVVGRRWKNQAGPDFAKARTFFEKAIYDQNGTGTQTAARSQFLIADTYLMQDNFTQAIREYNKVYTLYRYPDLQAQALFQVGGCQEKLQQNDGAARTWKLLIEEFPGTQWAKDAARQLAGDAG